MSRFFRAGLFRAGIAGMAVLVSVPGTMLGIAQPVGAASVAAFSHPIDHLLCYQIQTSQLFHPPPGVNLKNQFNPSGFNPHISDLPVVHCNPVQKTVPTGVFQVHHKDGHQLCFPISAATQQTPNVLVGNQFGQATLATGQPNTLCLPTWKSLTGPPNKTPNQPPGIDHYTCYPVQYIPGGGTYTPPAQISLKDQFGQTPVTVGNPVSLCVPTTKTVNTVVYKPHYPQQHLLCFQVSQTPRTSIYDQNQFGTGHIFLQQTFVLCLPSTKSIVKTITHITDTGTPEPSHVGQAVKFTGTVNPNPLGGSVSWTDGGTAIPGCTARPVNTSTGRATCNVTFNTVGTHPIIATYSGDTFYASSQSPTLNHMVT